MLMTQQYVQNFEQTFKILSTFACSKLLTRELKERSNDERKSTINGIIAAAMPRRIKNTITRRLLPNSLVKM
jgi:hypothetical protein